MDLDSIAHLIDDVPDSTSAASQHSSTSDDHLRQSSASVSTPFAPSSHFLYGSWFEAESGTKLLLTPAMLLVMTWWVPHTPTRSVRSFKGSLLTQSCCAMRMLFTWIYDFFVHSHVSSLSLSGNPSTRHDTTWSRSPWKQEDIEIDQQGFGLAHA